MKNYSFNLIKQHEEFTLILINMTGADFFIEPKRAVKKGVRIITANIFKDRKDSLQEQLFSLVPNTTAAGILSSSIPNGRVKVTISTNFHFSIKDAGWFNDNLQLFIGNIEN